MNKIIPLPLEGFYAVFSDDRVYRYELRRCWADGELVLWVMLNPSTADEVDDDPTVRRCIGFSRRWGYGGLVVCNLFGLRSTDPKMLKQVDDPAGPTNTETILRAAAECKQTVCGWGVHGAMGDAGTKMLRTLRKAGVIPHCLGVTRDGHPRHPLYVPYKQELVQLEDDR